MNISIFLAKVMGLYFVITGLFTIIRYKYLEENVKGLTNQPGTFFLLAIITLIIGILLVVSHNIWILDWRVIITILSWLILLGGIFRLFFQENVIKMGHLWLRHKGYFLTTSVIFLLIGCYLLYKGFFG